MSRKRREFWLEAQERWPQLQQFLAAYLNQDWPEEYETPEAAVEHAITEYSLEMKQAVLKEWRNWSVAEGSRIDPRPSINEGLGVNVRFKHPIDGRRFMNSVYDKVIVSVRKDFEGWIP